MNAKYLLIEDQEELRNLIADELRRSPSTEVLVADSGEAALATLEREPDIDLVVLDLTLQTEMYGLEVLRRIREFSNVPVVIHTSDPAPERQTDALERGVDGYMDKFRFDSPIQIRRHLEAFVRKRRSGTGGASGRYSFEGWTLDAGNRTLINPDGADVTLSSREFDLLLLFVERPQTILTPYQLTEKLGAKAGTDPQAAFTKLLSRLRKKLDNDRSAAVILNVHGKGFYFTPTVISSARA